MKNHSLNYSEELSNTIKFSNKLFDVRYIFSIIFLSISIFHLFIFCRRCEILTIIIIIQNVFDIIIWCISLAIENNVYKIKENLIIHEVIYDDLDIAVIIMTTIYLIYSIIIINLLFSESDHYCWEDTKHKIIYPLFFIFEYVLAIFILCILPKDEHYENNYLQEVYIKTCKKFGYCPDIIQIDELENLQVINKVFLSFTIFIFFLTFIKLFITAYAKCKDDEYKYRFLIPSFIQFTFIITNFGLIIVIASKVFKKGKTDGLK